MKGLELSGEKVKRAGRKRRKGEKVQEGRGGKVKRAGMKWRKGEKVQEGKESQRGRKVRNLSPRPVN